MSIIVLPTNVRLPTYLDGARAAYVRGEITAHDFEERVAALLADGTADDVDVAIFPGGMQTRGEPR